jgi:hypothetical protein
VDAADQGRWLARGPGYVASPAAALDKLECVSASIQAEQTAAAHLRWSREQRRRWGEAATTIVGAVDGFVNGSGLDPRLAADVRRLRRDVHRVTAHLDDDLSRAAGA